MHNSLLKRSKKKKGYQLAHVDHHKNGEKLRENEEKKSENKTKMNMVWGN